MKRDVARPQLMIRTLLFCTFFMILNETFFGVAVPSLMTEFGVSEPTAQWSYTIVLVTLGTVMPLSGFLLKRYQTRTIFFLATALMITGSAIGSLSTGFDFVLVARFIQAVGTALMIPLLYFSIVALVPPTQRGVNIARVAVVFAVAPSVGPPISGILLEALGWRALFAAIVLLAIVMLIVGARTVFPVGPRLVEPLDIPSVPLSFVGTAGLVLGIGTLVGGVADSLDDRARVLGSVGVILVGICGLALFAHRQFALQRAGAVAFLDLSVLRVRQFAISIAVMSLASVVLFSGLYLVTLFLVVVLRESPLVAGLAIVPGAIAQAVLSPIIGRRYDVVGPRALALWGIVLLIVAMCMMAAASFSEAVWLVIACHILASIALAFVFTPIFAHALTALPNTSHADGTAILGAFQHILGAIGVAVFVSIASRPDLFESSPRVFSYPLAFILAALIAATAIPLAARLKRSTSTLLPVSGP